MWRLAVDISLRVNWRSLDRVASQSIDYPRPLWVSCGSSKFLMRSSTCSWNERVGGSELTAQQDRLTTKVPTQGVW